MVTIKNPASAATTPRASRCSKIQDSPKHAENLDPNQHQLRSPIRIPNKPLFPNSRSSSPVLTKSSSAVKSHKKSKNPNPIAYSPRNKIRQRKFVIAKKKKEEEADSISTSTTSFCKCREKKGGDLDNNGKCLCVAYENLRKSQEEFFKNRVDEGASERDTESVIEEEEEEELGNGDVSELECGKRRRERVMEAVRQSVPQSGSGKVMNLVKAFEKLLSVPASKDEDLNEDQESQENHNTVMKWPLPAFQVSEPSETEVSGSKFCPPNCILTSQNLGLDPRASVSTSWDSSRGSVSSMTTNGGWGRRSRRNSLESSSTIGERRWRKKQLKSTRQQPFQLRTEQRGKLKEEEFAKKMQEMMTEEEKQRIPTAQGLPWTTDEPECLVKPPVKDITKPIDLKLHSDVRAMDRAEFDHQVAEKLSLIEQYKLERERQQKLAEEEEIRRLRKELVPKAQPMPYFDRPFIPRRSMKEPTIPREPKFHKKIKCSVSSSSWNDMSPYSSYLN